LTISPDKNASFLGSDGAKLGPWIIARYITTDQWFNYDQLNFELRAGDPIFLIAAGIVVVQLFYEPNPVPVS
jgi:hypothetical protein